MSSISLFKRLSLRTRTIFNLIRSTDDPNALPTPALTQGSPTPSPSPSPPGTPRSDTAECNHALDRTSDGFNSYFDSCASEIKPGSQGQALEPPSLTESGSHHFLEWDGYEFRDITGMSLCIRDDPNGHNENRPKVDANPAPPTDIHPNVMSLQDFRLKKALGEGASATVYAALHTPTDTKCAVKVMEKEQQTISVYDEQRTLRDIHDDERKRRFFVQMLASFQDSLNYYIVMPMYQSSLWDELAKNGGSLSEHRIRTVMAEMILGVSYMHDRRLLHRDLKPDNTFINNEGHIVIGDFGLSVDFKHKYGDALQEDFTQGITGSPIYMAPEVLSSAYYTYSADLWSLGIMMYIMVFGDCPWDLDSPQSFMKAVADEPVPFPERHTAAEGLIELLNGLLQKRPDQRITLEDAKKSPFFNGMNWKKVASRTNTPAFTPFKATTDSLPFFGPDAVDIKIPTGSVINEDRFTFSVFPGSPDIPVLTAEDICLFMPYQDMFLAEVKSVLLYDKPLPPLPIDDTVETATEELLAKVIPAVEIPAKETPALEIPVLETPALETLSKETPSKESDAGDQAHGPELPGKPSPLFPRLKRKIASLFDQVRTRIRQRFAGGGPKGDLLDSQPLDDPKHDMTPHGDPKPLGSPPLLNDLKTNNNPINIQYSSDPPPDPPAARRLTVLLDEIVQGLSFTPFHPPRSAFSVYRQALEAFACKAKQSLKAHVAYDPSLFRFAWS